MHVVIIECFFSWETFLSSTIRMVQWTNGKEQRKLSAWKVARRLFILVSGPNYHSPTEVLAGLRRSGNGNYQLHSHTHTPVADATCHTPVPVRTGIGSGIGTGSVGCKERSELRDSSAECLASTLFRSAGWARVMVP
jgi:hypothetical protein